MFLRGLRRIRVGPRWYSIQNLEVFGIQLRAMRSSCLIGIGTKISVYGAQN
jgi:hypothetical protein